MSRFPSLILLFLLPLSLWGEEPALKVRPTGRILIDGALYASPQKHRFPDGMAIPEVRLGANMTYGKWSSGIDVSYSYAKIGMRNMWIEYGFNPSNSIRIGNFIHQFGLQSTSQSVKVTFEQPVAATPFTPGLQLGAMYVHHSPKLYAAASFHVESSALTQIVNAPLFNKQGYGLLTRIAWRPLHSSDKVMGHIGLSGGFATPQRRVEDLEDVHDGFTISANFPTKVVQTSAVGATVTDSKNLFKVSPEIILASRRIAFEGEYYFQQITRRVAPKSYRAQSGYATLRGLITGGNYSYVSSTAQLANPTSKALECVLNYSYTNLTDGNARIYGGKCSTASVTFNYYINRYITARLNYFYAHTWDRKDFDATSLSGFQARLMVLF